MKIQPVKQSHQDQLFQMHEICFREHIEQIWGWDQEWQLNFFKKEWRNGEWRVLTDDEDDKKIIGYLMWKEKEDHIYLGNISLLPEYRNQGLGSAAMKYILEQADTLEVGVKLKTFRTNDKSLSFYRRFGFRTIEHVETGALLHRPYCQHGDV